MIVDVACPDLSGPAGASHTAGTNCTRPVHLFVNLSRYTLVEDLSWLTVAILQILERSTESESLLHYRPYVN